MSSRRLRSRALIAAALVGALALAGCGGDDTDPPGSSPQGVNPSVGLTAVSPLTGETLKGARPKHPILAVKIPNDAHAAPQVGLSKADLVTEELVEGGYSRLAAFFWTRVPSVVGPVRSMRASDIGIVKPLDAVLVTSGAATQTIARLRSAGVKWFEEGATGLYRDPTKVAPYNLFVHLDQLAATLHGKSTPAPYLPFSADGDLPKGKPARGLTARFSPNSSTSFSYRGGRYAQTDGLAAAGDEYHPETVLVLRVPVGDAGYRDPAGNPVPETKFTGSGPASIFTGGRMVAGTWSKDGYDADVRLQSGGREVSLPAGRVWLALVPASGGSVSFTR